MKRGCSYLSDTLFLLLLDVYPKVGSLDHIYVILTAS